jgi:hypothetical protein
MCEAGRIKHHLKHGLWNAATPFSSSVSSAGHARRSLIEGAEKVKLFGETIRVNAEIKQLPGISGHATPICHQVGYAFFAETAPRVRQPRRKRGLRPLHQRLRNEFGLDAVSPYSGSVYDLVKNEYVLEAKPEPLLNAHMSARRRKAARQRAYPLRTEGQAKRTIPATTTRAEIGLSAGSRRIGRLSISFAPAKGAATASFACREPDQRHHNEMERE